LWIALLIYDILDIRPFLVIPFNFKISVILINITNFFYIARLLHVVNVTYIIYVSMFCSIDRKWMSSREADRNPSDFHSRVERACSWSQGSQVFYTYASTVDEVLFVCAKDRLADYSTVTKWQIPVGNRFQHLLYIRCDNTIVILYVYVRQDVLELSDVFLPVTDVMLQRRLRK